MSRDGVGSKKGQSLHSDFNCNAFNILPKSIYPSVDILTKNVGITVAHINIRSLLKYFDQIKYILSITSIDVLCLNETRLSNDISDVEVAIPDYSIFRKDRTREGGGVAIYIKSDISCNILPDLTCDKIEALWLKIKCNHHKPLLLCAAYRPPSSPVHYLEDLKCNIEKGINYNLGTIIVGDFNIDLSNSTNSLCKHVHDMCQKLNIEQLINKPTRVTSTSSTIIDHIYTSVPHHHIKTDIVDTTMSDHFMIFTMLKFKSSEKKESKYIKTRFYNNFDESSFLRDIRLQFTDFRIENENINYMWHRWKTLFNYISTKYAPIRQKRVKNNHDPWITPTIINLMQNRDHAHKMWIKTKSLNWFSQFKRLRNTVTSLCHIFNYSLKTGTIPNEWKIGKVCPIFKGKGANDQTNNYRPITVLPHIAKIMEKLVHEQLMNYISTKSFISPEQSAFLKQHSTETALHKVVDDWHEAINDKLLVGLCTVDLRKCFDTICHETLLFKLFHYGIRNSEFNWFYSYLNDRKQIVSYNNSKSQCRPINIGIPQGSNLGPLLFILFINDITSHLPNYCYINLYADDTIIYCIHADINVVKQQLQASISQLMHWFKINKLSINSDKTNTMLLSSMKHKFRATKLDMKVDDTVLEQVEEIKYLGLVIDSHLTWKSHIYSLCKKISPKLVALARLSHILNKDTLLKIYNGTIQPILDYCCTVWGHCNTGFIHKLQTYQNRAARIILRNYDWTTHSRDLLNTLNLKGINYRISYFTVCLMFKCLNNLSP